MAMRGLPRSLDPVPEPDFDPGRRSLRVPPPLRLPRGAVVVLHRVDSLDTHLASRLFVLPRVPGRVATGAPVVRGGSVSDPGGALIRLSNVVDNESRLPPPELLVTAVAEDGTVALRVGGETVRLRPGTGWGIGYARGPDGVVAVPDGPDWEERMSRHLRLGGPVTVFSVFNHGRWRWSDVRSGPPPP